MRRRSLAALPLALALAVAACGGTPGEDKPNEQNAGTPADAGQDGRVRVARRRHARRSSRPRASGGPRDALKALSKSFEAKYPNVTVDITFRDFTAWTKQAKLVASSDNPPDVFGGNQGFQLDGELVKAGLILPLTEYSKAYGWEDSYSPETLQQFEWTDDGTDVRRGHAVGRRPDRPVRRRVHQQEEARGRGRRPRRR